MIKKTITYILRKSSKARRLRIEITPDAQVRVALPRFMSENLAESFVREKAKWIFQKIEEVKKLGPRHLKGSRGEYLENRDRAEELVREKLEKFNKFYNFDVRRISIRNQKSRFGSCSKKGNLNFNYKIAFLAEHLADYLVVHELCHLKEMNHSRKFWDLVKKTVPDYKRLRKELRRMKI